MTPKPWYASKTIWTNIVAGLAAIASVAGLDVLADPATQVEIVGVATAIANLALRFVTAAPIARRAA